MTIKYYFHICGSNKFEGTGSTAYLACVDALGQKSAERFVSNIKQGGYFIGDKEIINNNESGVSNIKSKNGVTIASITRIVE